MGNRSTGRALRRNVTKSQREIYIKRHVVIASVSCDLQKHGQKTYSLKNALAI